MNKCYLVGAGVGDLELITLKAKRLIQSADVIIYDYLIPSGILDWAGPDCELIYAGKHLDNKYISQEELNQILIQKCTSPSSSKKEQTREQRKKIIVRLKGGDPFVFARGYEEIEILVRHRIDFEIVPGVSSYSAVTTYAGIPLTTRQTARSFAVVTGHYTKTDKENKNLVNHETPFSPIVNDADTVIYLMAMKNLKAILQANLDYGKAKNTPVAIIEKGCTPHQKVHVFTLGHLLSEMEEKKLAFSHPGILIMGEVVDCREIAKWVEWKSLFGQRIILFKNQNELNELFHLLQQEGADIVTYSLLKSFPKTPSELEDYLKIKKIKLIPALKSKKNKILLFTSAKSISIFFSTLKLEGGDARLLANHKIIVIGEQTHRILKDYHLQTDYIATRPDQEGVLEVILKHNLNDILFLRAKEIRDFLEEQLTKSNIRFQSIVLYEMQETKSQIAFKNDDILLFTSSLMVKSFITLVTELSKETQKAMQNLSLKIICLGKVTHDTLQSYDFFKQSKTIKTMIADKPNFRELVKSCQKITAQKK